MIALPLFLIFLDWLRRTRSAETRVAARPGPRSVERDFLPAYTCLEKQIIADIELELELARLLAASK